MTRSPAIARRRGFALVSALFLTAAIAAVSLELSLLARDRRLASANVLEAAAVRAAADGGVETARARLAHLLVPVDSSVAPAIRDPWSDAGALVDSVTIGGARAHVSLVDLGARLHLGRATPTELQRLLVAMSLDAAEADRLAQRIADWRDADDFVRPNGAERDAYLRAGAPVLPRNAAFRDVDELRYVPGMTPALLARLRPLLTVEGTGRVNVNTAPRAVLLALPGMTDDAVAVAERARRAGRPITSVQQLHAALSPRARRAMDREAATLATRLSFETQELLVRSIGTIAGSPVRLAVEAVLVRGTEDAMLSARRTTWSGEPLPANGEQR